MIYEIYLGVDNKVKNTFDEKKMASTQSYKKAMSCYELAKKQCEKLYNNPVNKENRIYCYMIRINTERKLYGYKNGKKIDNGCFSETFYANNYFHNHEYYQDFIIEEGRRYPEL